MTNEEYRQEIIRIVSETDSFALIGSIYSFIMGMLSVGKEGAV